MRKWMFACAVVTVASFLADPVSAQAQVQSSGTVITESVPQSRSGIFSRLRNRRSTPTTVSQPITTTTTAPMAKAMPGTTGATPSKVQQAQAVETPMTTTTTTPVVETRQGILSRLRLRR